MELQKLKELMPKEIINILLEEGIRKLRPVQIKALEAGLLNGKNILACTPTASGKTLIAELAALKTILEGKGKAIYIVPLVALANEKYQDFKRKWGKLIKVALSVGDFDSSDPYLIDYDFIICTAEKLDSLIRHSAPWLNYVKLIVVDEIHTLNDIKRGPILEILITLLKELLPNVQIIALSATIGNPEMLAAWLNANLIKDDWRPVKLKKGIYFKDKIEFY